MNRRTVADFLVEHKRQDPISFHMPGHKGRSRLYKELGYGDFLKNIMGSDITEIPGADALTQPESVIRRVMENYAALYGARHTELLVNGSSTGLIASVLATVPRGGKLIMGRNSHKSVFSALRLGGIEPVYIKPLTDEKTGLQGAISPRDVAAALREHPDASAVLVTSPNYYGVLSEIEDIALEAHAAGKVLIVDQAHGAHLKFFDEGARKKRAAENLRADLVVNSTHKTLMSFTGTAILNVCSDRVDVSRISETVRMLQTTSPSYILMGSLDVNEKILRHGQELFQAWQSDLQYFYENYRSVTGLSVIENRELDRSKINLNMKPYGFGGQRLAAELQEQNIWVEMVHGDYAMLMTGLGNERRDYEKLLEALQHISGKYGITENEMGRSEDVLAFNLEQGPIPSIKERIPLAEATGRRLYDSLIPYPPGIPLACPGEILTKEAVQYLQERVRRNETVIGVDENGYVCVAPEV